MITGIIIAVSALGFLYKLYWSQQFSIFATRESNRAIHGLQQNATDTFNSINVIRGAGNETAGLAINATRVQVENFTEVQSMLRQLKSALDQLMVIVMRDDGGIESINRRLTALNGSAVAARATLVAINEILIANGLVPEGTDITSTRFPGIGRRLDEDA